MSATPRSLVILPPEILLLITDYLGGNLDSIAASSKRLDEVVARQKQILAHKDRNENKRWEVLVWRVRPFCEGRVSYTADKTRFHVYHDSNLERWRDLVDASKPGRIDDVRALLNDGVSPNVPLTWPGNHRRWAFVTPLQIATRENYFEIVELLLRAGARILESPALPDDREDIIRLLSEEKTDPKIVARLIQHGHDTNVDWGRSVLVHRREEFEDLDEEIYVHPAIIAAEQGAMNAVRVFLAKGLDPSTKDTHNGKSLFSWVAGQGDTVMTRLLLEMNADIHAVDKHKQSALFWAANHSVETTRILLEAGANVHAVDDDGKTPLFVAMSKAYGQMGRSVADKQADICRLLLKYGASDHDLEGKSAYRFALKEGLGEILQIFIMKGARLYLVLLYKGTTPL
ncbi:ankyrin repeat-containing domain protein [Aspergillus venezuelensis]